MGTYVLSIEYYLRKVYTQINWRQNVWCDYETYANYFYINTTAKKKDSLPPSRTRFSDFFGLGFYSCGSLSAPKRQKGRRYP